MNLCVLVEYGIYLQLMKIRKINLILHSLPYNNKYIIIMIPFDDAFFGLWISALHLDSTFSHIEDVYKRLKQSARLLTNQNTQW